MAKKRYALIDAQDEKRLEIHVAFMGNDNPDQIICELPESVVLSLVKSYYDIHELMYSLPIKDFEIDIDVAEYIKGKFGL